MARPPRLPDETILELIALLRTRHAVLTGTRLREELQARHGAPCGVSRVYRLLHQAAQPPPAQSPTPPPTLPAEVAALQAELTAALERAHLAEYREDHHQARWATEVHALREQVKGHGDATYRLRVLEQDLLDRSRELASAYLRIADLEARHR